MCCTETVRLEGTISPGAYSFALVDTGSIAWTRPEFDRRVGKCRYWVAERPLGPAISRKRPALEGKSMCDGRQDEACHNRYCGCLGSINNGSLAVVRARLE